MTNPKWEIGPVKLIDGTEGYIEFVQPESELHRYIGRVKFNGSEWRASHWCDAGRVPYTLTGNPKNLAPPPKKTVRVQRYVNVFEDGCMVSWATREQADGCRSSRFACIEIDREVTEGEGL